MKEMDETSSRILIVDDEESLRTTFQMFLSREGYGPITTAATFEEANDYIESQAFDLIISDIIMEGSSGIDPGGVGSRFHEVAPPYFDPEGVSR